MTQFDDEMKELLAKRIVPSVNVDFWQREWRSVHKHREPHCRARLKDGDYCQNQKFPGSQFCRVHADIKFQYCCATTVTGRRCSKRPYKDGLCHIHIIRVNEQIAKENIASIKLMLSMKGDIKERK